MVRTTAPVLGPSLGHNVQPCEYHKLEKLHPSIKIFRKPNTPTSSFPHLLTALIAGQHETQEEVPFNG